MAAPQGSSQPRPARGRGGTARRGNLRNASGMIPPVIGADVSGTPEVSRSEGQLMRGRGRTGGRGRGGHPRSSGRNGNTGTSDTARHRESPRTLAEHEGIVGTSPAEMAKQAKQWAGQLNGLLKEKTPWDPEVERIRMKIRNQYSVILLQYPTSPIGQSIEPLWIFTSHILIGAYRLLIAEFEKKVQEFIAQRAAIPNALRRGRGRGGGRDTSRRSHGSDGTGPGPVEMRKLLSRFKSFLGSEQKFYKETIAKVVEAFGLRSEVEAYLDALDIPLVLEEGERTGGRQPGQTRLSEEDRTRGVTPTGRTTPTLTSAPPNNASRLTRDEVTKKVGMVHKALVCLGDLERYREQYGPDKDKSQAIPKGKTVMKKEVPAAQEQYAGAKRYYEIARGLLPENGNPSNQLAVVSSYCHDTFSAIYHYFRALTVQDPFQTAEYNLAKTLRKALRDWEMMREEDEAAQGGEFSDLVPGSEVANLKREEVVLQAIMYSLDDCSGLQPLMRSHLEHFAHLLRDRQVPSEIIVKTLVLGVMSHWHAKINLVAEPVDANSPSATIVTLEYLLGIAGVMLRVAIQELEQEMGSGNIAAYENEDVVARAPPVFDDDSEGDDTALHKRLSAVTRRMLPALRIFSKWLKSNQDQVKALLEDRAPSVITLHTTVQESAQIFWKTYFDFLGRLEWILPIERLPKLSDQLEEDLDMKGLSPLNRGMSNGDPREDTQGGDRGRKRPLSEVHPNEEQLMRVSDLLIDGKLLLQRASIDGTIAGRFASRVFASDTIDGELDPAGITPPARQHVQLPLAKEALSTNNREAAPSERETDMASVSTETEDDPVNLAMRATMLDGSSLADEDDERSMLGEESSDEEEEEKILWKSTAQGSNPGQLPGVGLAGPSIMPETSTPHARPAMPSLPPGLAPPPAPATAQSLLHALMVGQPGSGPSAGPTTPNAGPSTSGTGAQTKRSSLGNAHGASLLFGGGASGTILNSVQGSNIWSTGTNPVQSNHAEESFAHGQPGPGGIHLSRSSISAQGGGGSGMSVGAAGANPWGPPSSSPSPAGIQSGWGTLGNGSSRFGTPLMGGGVTNMSSTPPALTAGIFTVQHPYGPSTGAEMPSSGGGGSVPMPRTGSTGAPSPAQVAMVSGALDAQVGGAGVIGQGFRHGPGGSAGWG